MSETVEFEKRLPGFFKQFVKLNEYILAISLVFYISGFIIANMYLGSLGVISFDVLRVRYILIGISFAGFIAAILLPLRGFIKLLIEHHNKPLPTLIIELFVYSFYRYLVIFLLVSAISLLAGKKNQLPVGIPHLSETLPFSDWLYSALPKVVETNARFWLIGFLPVFGLVILVGIAVTIINPKNKTGSRQSRRDAIKSLWSIIFSKSSLGFCIGSLALLLITGAINSLISFISTNSLTSLSGASSTSTSSILESGSIRFLFASALIYSLCALYLAYFFFIRSKEIDDPQSESKKNQLIGPSVGLLIIISYAILIIMPLYAIGVYPSLPQQIGGGGVVRVDVTTSNDELAAQLSLPEMETYLVDRTSDYVIFLLVNNEPQSHEVIQVENSQVQIISYGPFP